MSKYDSDADVLRDLLNPSMIVKCELNNTNDYQDKGTDPLHIPQRG